MSGKARLQKQAARHQKVAERNTRENRRAEGKQRKVGSEHKSQLTVRSILGSSLVHLSTK